MPSVARKRVSDMKNSKRADMAEQAVLTYSKLLFPSGYLNLGNGVKYLLGDLQHLCDQEGLGFEDLLKVGGRCHRKEVAQDRKLGPPKSLATEIKEIRGVLTKVIDDLQKLT